MTEDKFSLIGDKDVIVLKAAAKSAKHTVQPAKDRKSGWYAGIPRLSDDDKKELKYYVTPETKLTLVDNFTFDLSNEIDRINWEWVKWCPQIAASYADIQSNPEAFFYVHIEGREAREKNKISETKFQAQSFIMNDNAVNYESRCLLLGMDMSGEPSEVQKEYLMEKAIADPEEIIRIYTVKNLAIHLLFLTAKRKGLIKEARGVLQYGSHVLGLNDEASIAFLQEKDSKFLVELMEREVNPQYFVDSDIKKTEASSTEEVSEVAKDTVRTHGFQKKK